jgi:SagB-type dehydrogenase family enzyme
MRRGSERFRSSRSAVVFWAAGYQQSFNWKQRKRAILPAGAATFLDRCGDWTTFDDLCAHFGGAQVADTLSSLLENLIALGVIESSEAPEAASAWDEWHPDAAFFHYATRDQRYDRDPFDRDRVLREKARTIPQPPPTKRTAGPLLPLPGPGPTVLDQPLLRRRTWRRFSNEKLSLAALSTVLDRTFRVQVWGEVEGQGIVAHKTSPSAGARTPIEAYVLALNVDGLRNAVYHYDAAAHHLVDLGSTATRRELVDLLANQHFYAGAGAVIVMTAMFERAMWRYPFGRAYRMVLLDAGHLGQTFCLVATALGLAPFCTMAFSEGAIETLLGIDGVMECPMYVVGVGVPPEPDDRNPGDADPGTVA